MAGRSVQADISNAFSRLQAEYYGRGPLKAKTYMTDALVVVTLEETFTPAVQQAMREQFSSIVEQATGRRVRAFVSEPIWMLTWLLRSSCWRRRART